jgi:small subunit ribosomal protein S4
MEDAKCKICRRHGEKLYLKGERCYSPKCALVRKPYPPGIHGRSKKGRREGSEYSKQLHEKQKVRFLYGVSERQFSNYVGKALESRGGDVMTRLSESLELRLDNVVFRLGFMSSRSFARQAVAHGHLYVNGKRVFVPSYRVRKDDVISIAPGSKPKGLFTNLEVTLKKHQTPKWLLLVPEKREGTVTALPRADDVVQSYNIKSIIEYYSR